MNRLEFLFLAFLFFFGKSGDQVSSLKIVGKVTKNYYWALRDPNAKAMSWEEASMFCKENGMTLASITTAEEQALLLSLRDGKTINGYQGYNFWLGGFYNENKKEWTWQNGNSVQYNQWESYWSPQPANESGICMWASATYWGLGKWFSMPCTAQGFFPLCEIITTEFYGQN